jgi:hypothetical protein
MLEQKVIIRGRNHIDNGIAQTGNVVLLRHDSGSPKKLLCACETLPA